MFKRIPILVGALAVLGASASAQSIQPTGGLSVEAGALYNTVDGDDFEGTNAGMGFDVQGRYAFSNFSLGVGFQRSSHDIDDASDNIIATAFFVEPRLAIPTSAGFTPFLMARIGRAKQSLETDIPDYGSAEMESSGLAFGFGGGLEFAIAFAAKLNLTASYSRISFDDIEVDGTTIPDSDSSGSSVMLRAGVGFTFGGR